MIACGVQLTGIPAGRNRSRLWAGMMKQSRSIVDSDTGSLRMLPYVLPGPPKLTARAGIQTFNKLRKINSIQLFA